MRKEIGQVANEKQFRTRTRYLATRGVAEYRATIPQVVRQPDSILELGCEFGTTTALLAEQAARVIGADVSPQVVEKARRLYPAIDFRVLDAFDVLSLQALSIHFTKIYLDLSGISGYRSLLDTIALLNSYAAVLRPELIVVKSGALKDFAKNCAAWSAS